MRLIDADALTNEILDHDNGCIDIDFNLVIDLIANAPTVIADNYSMGYQDGVKKVLSERPTGELKEVGND